MIGIFRQLQWVILQYDYNVNTTVLKLLYPTNSKAQHYKANGHISIDLFLMNNKNKSNTQKKKMQHFALVQSHTFVQFPNLVTIPRQITTVSGKHLSPVHLISHGHLMWAWPFCTEIMRLFGFLWCQGHK